MLVISKSIQADNALTLHLRNLIKEQVEAHDVEQVLVPEKFFKIASTGLYMKKTEDGVLYFEMLYFKKDNNGIKQKLAMVSLAMVSCILSPLDDILFIGSSNNVSMKVELVY